MTISIYITHGYKIKFFIHVSNAILSTPAYLIQCRKTLFKLPKRSHFKTIHSLKEFYKIFLIHFAFGYSYQMVSRPFHSINPLGRTEAVSSATAMGAIGQALAIGLVMTSITPVNMTVQ